MVSNKKLHFMHLHKTGGTSLFYFIERQFKFDEVCPFVYLRKGPEWVDSEQILTNINDEIIRQYKFFKGHLGWLPRTLFTDNEIETITFLREPILRSLSYYNYVKGSLAQWDSVPSRWQGFEDFVFDEEFGLELHSNYQTKSFCSDLFFQKANSMEPPNAYVESGGVLWAKIDLSPQQMLNLAIERLHACAFIGLTEQFDDSFLALCKQYKWLPPKRIPQDNVSIKQEKQLNLPPKLFNRVAELNELDIQLYEEAKKIFADRKKFRIYYTPEDLRKEVIKKMPKAKEIKFTFADKIIGEGWDAREGKWPNLFAWNSSTNSTLSFGIKKKSRLDISFKVIHTLFSDLEEKLKLAVNSHPVDLNRRFHSDGGLVFEGQIAGEVFNQNENFIELLFSIPEVRQPPQGNSTRDARRLGFALSELEIKPQKNDFLVKIIYKILNRLQSALKFIKRCVKKAIYFVL